MPPPSPRRLPRLAVRGACLTLLALLAGCREEPGSPAEEKRQGGPESPRPAEVEQSSIAGKAAASSRPPRPALHDIAAESNLLFTYFNGMSGRLYYPEVVGAGVALFDYDNDGDLDVYLGQGHLLGENVDEAEATFPSPKEPGDRLFRNDLTMAADGSRRVRFVDVTRASGIAAHGYAMGMTTGDIDGDGWVDLYVTNLGANQLWRNNGDGTFTDATERSGTGDALWGSSAAFVDYDRDGDLDLVVGNYLDFRLRNHKACFALSGLPGYCGPLTYEPLRNLLYRNRGDGTFEDVSLASGLGRTKSRTLGVVVSDFNRDGWTDIYFANDAEENELWMNRQDGTFSDEALLAGAAVNMEGRAEAGMGVDVGDFDNDGDDDLILAHLKTETNTLYVNNGRGEFTDETLASGLGTASWEFTGFGAGWFDYDNDGWLDLLVANGLEQIDPVLAQQGDPFPLDQPNLLFRNLGDGRFEEVSRQVGEVLTRPQVSRGAAFGDLDNDGDTDIAIVNNCGSAQLLLNGVGSRSHWLGLRLVGGLPPGDILGARLQLLQTSFDLHRRVRSDGSYLSAQDPRVLFGLGESSHIVALLATLPSDKRLRVTAPPADRYLVVQAVGVGRRLDDG